MAQNDFRMTFAGIPFLLDSAKLVKLPFKPPENEAAINLAPLKHQPKDDLIEELNKRLDRQYLQDFTPPSPYPGRNLGALANSWSPDEQPNPLVKINDWYVPNLATRWSVFRGLVTSSMARAMLAASTSTTTLSTQGGSPITGTGWVPQTFRIEQTPIGPYEENKVDKFSISTQMYLLPSRPLGEQGGNFDGLYLVTLVDERYYWQYQQVTLQLDQTTTWQGLISRITAALGISVSYSPIEDAYGQPEKDSQIWSNVENAAFLLDVVAYNIGRTLVRGMDGGYTLQTASEGQNIAYANRAGWPPGTANAPDLINPDGSIYKGPLERTPIPVVRVAGGDIFCSGSNNFQFPFKQMDARAAVVPNVVNVSFPKYVQGDDPVPHFSNPRYKNQRPSNWFEESYGETWVVSVPILSGNLPGIAGTLGFEHGMHTTAKALFPNEASMTSDPVNASGLTSLAMKMAQEYWNSQTGAAFDEVYPGIVAWTPESSHDIIWSFSAKMGQASTRVMKTEWNEIVREFQHATIPIPGTTNTPKGVGGPSVAQSFRDGYSGSLSHGPPSTLLAAPLAVNATTVSFTDQSYFPTQNRWRGTIGSVNVETILFEGTSGGSSVGIVYRGIDGTIATDHQQNESVKQVIPSATYGVNLVNYEKSQFAYPSQWTSGGIQGVNIVPQTQTVLTHDNNGRIINGTIHYSGSVNIYDEQIGNYNRLENIWIVERNAQAVTVGKYFDGQLVDYSSRTGQNIHILTPDLGATMKNTGNDFLPLQAAFTNVGFPSIGATMSTLGAAWSQIGTALSNGAAIPDVQADLDSLGQATVAAGNDITTAGFPSNLGGYFNSLAGSIPDISNQFPAIGNGFKNIGKSFTNNGQPSIGTPFNNMSSLYILIDPTDNNAPIAPVYLVSEGGGTGGGGGSSTLTVKNFTLPTTVQNVDTITFNDITGLFVEQLGPGNAGIKLIPPTIRVTSTNATSMSTQSIGNGGAGGGGLLNNISFNQLYTGRIQIYNDTTGIWSDLHSFDDCWIFDNDGGILEKLRYEGDWKGIHFPDGFPIFSTDGIPDPNAGGGNGSQLSQVATCRLASPTPYTSPTIVDQSASKRYKAFVQTYNQSTDTWQDQAPCWLLDNDKADLSYTTNRFEATYKGQGKAIILETFAVGVEQGAGQKTAIRVGLPEIYLFAVGDSVLIAGSTALVDINGPQTIAFVHDDYVVLDTQITGFVDEPIGTGIIIGRGIYTTDTDALPLAKTVFVKDATSSSTGQLGVDKSTKRWGASLQSYEVNSATWSDLNSSFKDSWVVEDQDKDLEVKRYECSYKGRITIEIVSIANDGKVTVGAGGGKNFQSGDHVTVAGARGNTPVVDGQLTLEQQVNNDFTLAGINGDVLDLGVALQQVPGYVGGGVVIGKFVFSTTIQPRGIQTPQQVVTNVTCANGILTVTSKTFNYLDGEVQTVV